MYIVNHQEHCGEYRYCPERQKGTVSLRGRCPGQDGLRFFVKGTKVRLGYFFRVACMLGRSVRRRVVQMCRRGCLSKMGYRSLEIRRAVCCARL